MSRNPSVRPRSSFRPSIQLSDSGHRARLFASSAVLLCACVSVASSAIQFEAPGLGEGIDFTAQGVLFGQGVAFFDLEGDGDLDVYVCSGAGFPNRLFVNEGDFVFAEAIGAMGANDMGEAKGVAAVDYDNDGDPDIYVNHWGTENRLYRNDGVSGFVDVTTFAGVGGGGYYSTGLAWADVNGDGYLDLYVANRGITAAGEPNELFMNQGDGTFEEVAVEFGVALGTMSFQPVFTDYDNDGDPDLYVATDKFQINRLFRNDGGLGFTDMSTATGSDLAMDGMGLAVGDINQDGDPDFYVTNTNPGHRCLVSEGDGTFREAADELGIAVYLTGWGCVFFDADLDADEDLIVVNEGPNRFFRNDAGDQGPWADVSAAVGIDASELSFGVAVADLDNDGDLDVYVSNGNAPCEMYKNTTTGAGNWLQISLTGTVSNRDAIGARVEVENSGAVQIREIQAGSSYLAQMRGRASFGLGAANVAERLTVRWPSGLVESWFDVQANQILELTEGSVTSVDPTASTSVSASALRLSPNPFRAEVWVETDLAYSSAVTLRVFDGSGRLLRTRELGMQEAGPLRVSWDRRDAAGERVPDGVYWMKIEAPGSASADRLPVRAVAIR